MGNDYTTLSCKDSNSLNIDKYLQISAKHKKKIYKKNVKSFQDFSFIVKTICLRVSYLKYEWAKWIHSQLDKDTNKIYDEYCLKFQQSLAKKNEYFQTFHVQNFDSHFIIQFQNKAKQLQKSIISTSQFEKFFQQAKCYFMVQNWFADLPLNSHFKCKQATQSSKQNEQCDKKHEILIFKKQRISQEKQIQEKIYRILLRLSETYFENNYHKKQNNQELKQCQSPRFNPMKRFNSFQKVLIKSISKQQRFKNRQEIIIELLDSILNIQNQANKVKFLSQPSKRKINLLIRILGLKKVFCVLKVLKQVGQTDNIQKFQIVFDFAFQNIVKKLDQNPQANSEEETSKKSPYKKRRSSRKNKTESFR